MPRPAPSKTRAVKNQEYGSNRKSTQTTPGAAKQSNGGSGSSAGRKRSLKDKNDAASTQASKRVKTSSAVSEKPTKPPPLNSVPSKHLAILTFGGGESGELGLGPKKKEVTRPTRNPTLSKINVIQVACGGMHTVVLTADNKIVTWGVNDENALGRDTTWDGNLRNIDAESNDSDDEDDLNPLESTPMEIPAEYFPSGVQFVQVAAGDSCSFALTTTGDVYGWGTFRDSRGDKGFRHDEKGKLIENQTRPVLIQGLHNITQICCGVDHALALDSSGNIWAWGCNEQYQFGRRLFGRHSNPLTPTQVRVCRKRAKYIASGSYHSFAIDRDDNVWGWGANGFGEAGDTKTAGENSAFVIPTKIHDLCQKQVVAIDGGAHHSAAVTADRQCFVWGRILEGQLGVAFTAEQLQDSTRILNDERDKPRICSRPTLVPDLRVIKVACGLDHTILIHQSGHAYSTGYGFQGQLGLNSNDDVDVFQRIVDKRIKDKLIWAGAGAHRSVVAEPATDDEGEKV